MTTTKPQQDEFKLIKQRLSAIQLVIKKDLKEGRHPPKDDADRFIEISSEMDRLCENEWRVAMNRYIDRLEEFKIAMKSGDLQVIENTFHELIECKNACHQEFRQR